jgi:hypothetical protein
MKHNMNDLKKRSSNESVYLHLARYAHVRLYIWYIQGGGSNQGRIQMNDISKHAWSCTQQVHQILGISPHMLITRHYVVRSGTWSNCWKQPMSLRVKLAKDFGSHMAEQAYHSVWKQHFPWWKYREVITHNVYMITSTGHGTIHRNLDTTRQDVQKAAVAAFRIAGFW